MRKFISIILSFVFLLFALSGCAVPEEDRVLGGHEALNRITSILDAKEIYTGVSESHYMDDEYMSKIENSAYYKENMSVMWHYEDDTENGENESYIRKIGKSEKVYGDFDFKGTYGNDYSKSFISSTTSSLISILQSNVFDATEDENGFVMVCNDKQTMERSNSFIYETLEDGTTFAEFLGDDIQYSLIVQFTKNEYDGLNIVSRTVIEGSEHTLEILKIVQFILNDDGLENIKQDIANMDFSEK